MRPECPCAPIVVDVVPQCRLLSGSHPPVLNTAGRQRRWRLSVHVYVNCPGLYDSVLSTPGDQVAYLARRVHVLHVPSLWATAHSGGAFLRAPATTDRTAAYRGLKRLARELGEDGVTDTGPSTLGEPDSSTTDGPEHD